MKKAWKKFKSVILSFLIWLFFVGLLTGVLLIVIYLVFGIIWLFVS